MAGSGFIGLMIASLKANKQSHISTFEKIKGFKKGKKVKLLFPNIATKKDLKKVKEKIQQQNNIQFYKNIVIIMMLLILSLFLINLDNY